jgi:hypothetical protein
MPGYSLHAGNVLEPAPRGQQANYRGNATWFDFGACAVPTDAEGVRHTHSRPVTLRTTACTPLSAACLVPHHQCVLPLRQVTAR